MKMKLINPKGPGSYRVTRGGSWRNNVDYLVVSFRTYYSPGYRDGNLGFRIVCSGRKR